MGRYNRASSYGHNVRACPWGGYRISWVIDRYYSGSRLRHPRRFERDADEEGAKRFCKKWNIQMPVKETK